MTIGRGIGRLFQFLFVEPVIQHETVIQNQRRQQSFEAFHDAENLLRFLPSGLNGAQRNLNRKGKFASQVNTQLANLLRRLRDKPKVEAEASTAPTLTSGIRARVRGYGTR